MSVAADTDLVDVDPGGFETAVAAEVETDDDVAADGIFTVLMGDQVEPRREFIERFALDVRNLDV